METVNEKGQISLVCGDLLLKILAPEDERYSLEEIRAHPFYSIIDWSLYDNPHASALPNKVEITSVSQDSLFQSRVIPVPDQARLDPLLTDLTEPDTSTGPTNTSELGPEQATASTSHNSPAITSS